ncbi:MAG: class I SAM-dependent methyltransferase [Fimbriimonadaceae bacterium]|nr:class I SAM-dependent methyltransferase [Fimbriimonadaceae bacterium]
MWERSAEAWIAAQGPDGDRSRKVILDPALGPLLGDLSGLHVLDVGCGEGRYARKMAAKGAIVTGLDPTPAFILCARTQSPNIDFVRAGAEAIPMPENSYDLSLSYLSLVDIRDDRGACAEMVRVTKVGGRIVVVTISNVASTSDGWERDEQGRAIRRTVDRYMGSFAMNLKWKGIEITNYHRPLSRILGHFLKNGCVLTQFVEPLPDPEDPSFAEEFRVPTFQIYCFQKEV